MSWPDPAEGQMKFFRGVAKMIEHDARLHNRDTAPWIEFDDFDRYLEKSRTTATLQHCPASEIPRRGEAEDAVFAANRSCRDHVLDVAGNYDGDWDLTIIRTVGYRAGCRYRIGLRRSHVGAAQLQG